MMCSSRRKNQTGAMARYMNYALPANVAKCREPAPVRSGAFKEAVRLAGERGELQGQGPELAALQVDRQSKVLPHLRRLPHAFLRVAM